MGQRARKNRARPDVTEGLPSPCGRRELADFLAKAWPGESTREPGGVLFICIGSDRSTGDAYGPLVGSMLKERGFPHVIGTLEKPCDAHAVEEAVREAAALRERVSFIVAIDACLGKPESVGCFLAAEGPLQPGAAIGRRLPFVGDVSIAGVVNMHGPKAYGMLQTTSLHLVMEMAKQTADAICEAWFGKGP
ncbi:spore protease YyaC [Paenibacillus soyae]|uniref:Spore protease YyaC n=1 Tax=Paenibacillus soyae TaxID=2969249 RepID=A0A9X2SA54_9BACL|nr:spore protease YyaC [Paenibacillus soyae]MCR2803452.1 spore protease YyaC [Paenibacillus soyae]